MRVLVKLGVLEAFRLHHGALSWRMVEFVELEQAELDYQKIDHFVKVALGAAPLLVSGHDGRDSLELVMAI